VVTDLLLTPYLPLSKEMTIREWQLVPFKTMHEAEIVPEALAKQSSAWSLPTVEMTASAQSSIWTVSK
jgi:hypothetical protein